MTMSRHSDTSYQFAICIRNDGYPAALEPRKIYQLLPDPEAEKHGQVRVIDESGEDYLYPKEFFVHVDLPLSAQQAIIKAA